MTKLADQFNQDWNYFSQYEFLPQLLETPGISVVLGPKACGKSKYVDDCLRLKNITSHRVNCLEYSFDYSLIHGFAKALKHTVFYKGKEAKRLKEETKESMFQNCKSMRDILTEYFSKLKENKSINQVQDHHLSLGQTKYACVFDNFEAFIGSKNHKDFSFVDSFFYELKYFNQRTGCNMRFIFISSAMQLPTEYLKIALPYPSADKLMEVVSKKISEKLYSGNSSEETSKSSYQDPHSSHLNKRPNRSLEKDKYELLKDIIKFNDDPWKSVENSNSQTTSLTMRYRSLINSLAREINDRLFDVDPSFNFHIRAASLVVDFICKELNDRDKFCREKTAKDELQKQKGMDIEAASQSMNPSSNQNSQTTGSKAPSKNFMKPVKQYVFSDISKLLHNLWVYLKMDPSNLWCSIEEIRGDIDNYLLTSSSSKGGLIELDISENERTFESKINQNKNFELSILAEILLTAIFVSNIRPSGADKNLLENNGRSKATRSRKGNLKPLAGQGKKQMNYTHENPALAGATGAIQDPNQKKNGNEKAASKALTKTLSTLQAALKLRPTPMDRILTFFSYFLDLYYSNMVDPVHGRIMSSTNNSRGGYHENKGGRFVRELGLLHYSMDMEALFRELEELGFLFRKTTNPYDELDKVAFKVQCEYSFIFNLANKYEIHLEEYIDDPYGRN